MNIILSDIIPSSQDAFWENKPSIGAGSPQKPVLVVVNSYSEGSADGMQLYKMLEACKMTPEQYNIVQLNENENIAWHQLKQSTGAKFVFLIGIHPARLGISSLFRINEANSFNECIWLPTVTINELESNKDIKTHLWVNGMRPIFVDKKYGELTVS